MTTVHKGTAAVNDCSSSDTGHHQERKRNQFMCKLGGKKHNVLLTMECQPLRTLILLKNSNQFVPVFSCFLHKPQAFFLN